VLQFVATAEIGLAFQLLLTALPRGLQGMMLAFGAPSCLVLLPAALASRLL
jgi:hypothetical protein